jgi:hypothetical protein
MTTTYDKVRPNSLQQASGSHEYTYEYIQTGSVEQKKRNILDDIIIIVLFA